MLGGEDVIELESVGGDSTVEMAFEGDYDQKIAEIKKEAAPAPDAQQAPENKGAEPPLENESGKDEEFILPVKEADWNAKATNDFGQYLNHFKETPSVKTEEDYDSMRERFRQVEYLAYGDEVLKGTMDRLNMDDNGILEIYIRDKSGEFDTEEDIKSKLEKYYGDDLKMTSGGKQIVERAKAYYNSEYNKRLSDINDQAVKEAKNFVEYRRNVDSYVKDLVIPSIKGKSGDVEVETGEIKMPNTLKYDLVDFVKTGRYDKALNSRELNTGEGYKAKVEAAMWVNPKTREYLLNQAIAKAYAKGQSDTIKSIK